MTRPGTVIISRDQATSATAPTDTGTWFVAGLAEKGSPTEPQLVTSMQAASRLYGDRVAYSVLLDALEQFFREGGRRAYVVRVVGPAATSASVDLQDGAAAVSLTVTASSPGEWANDLTVEVEAGANGGFVLVIADADSELERSPELADQAEAVAWSETSDYVTVTAGASALDPAVAAAAPLTGGDDDREAITDAQRIAALDLFPRDLGPGQVSFPGASNVEVHDALLQHGRDRNRRAILDAPDTAVRTALEAASDAIRALEGGALAQFGGLFARWTKIAGLTRTTTRSVPPSAAVAGRIAAMDAKGNPNVPAAGENGRLVSVVGFTQPEPTEADREALTEAGVNVIRTVYGEPRIYGFRTVADRDAYPLHWQLANVRTDMAVAAKCEAVAERFVLKQLDGKGLTIAQFGGELTSVLADFYRVGALYGDTFDEAALVDVGDAVNTPESIEAGELNAVVAIKRSPMAELVIVQIVRVRITEAV